MERLFVDTSIRHGGGELDFSSEAGTLYKWTVLPAGKAALAQLNYLVLACATQHDVGELRCLFPLKQPGPNHPVTVESVLVRHYPHDCGPFQSARHVSGWVVPPKGAITPLEESRHWAGVARFKAPPLGRTYGGWFLLAYGSRVQADPGPRCLEFTLNYRRKRWASLLDSRALLTSPAAFLEQLHFRGITCGRPRSRHLLATLNGELASWFGIAPECWLNRQHDFRRDWNGVAKAHRQPLTVLLDATRHVLEFAGRTYRPWHQPGVLVMDRPECWCPPEEFADYLRLLDRLFPQLQFFLRLGVSGCRAFPRELQRHTLLIPQPEPRPPKPRPKAVPHDTVLLVDVDAPMPNLALMKLSRFFKNQGRRVALSRVCGHMPEVDSVFASCIFQTPPSGRRVDALRQRFGPRLELGGSGISLKTRLPRHVEELEADYSLYPALGQRAIGFLTRGCPRHCPFCVVPLKEGKPRLVSELDPLLQGRKKLILLDDNLLAHPKADELLEQMAELHLAVNFNQTLDVRLLTPRRASLLRRIQCSNASFTRRCYHFSLNNTSGLETVRERLKLLQLSRSDNVEFICMYGFRTTLAEDLERFRFLRSLPGTYVFVQKYQPAPGGPDADLTNFFDEHAEANLDALVEIVFPQNMKSMEVYYRWLCLLYARQRGRIHRRLMDTLFRYNHRRSRGTFTAKLQAICHSRQVGAVAGCGGAV